MSPARCPHGVRVLTSELTPAILHNACTRLCWTFSHTTKNQHRLFTDRATAWRSDNGQLWHAVPLWCSYAAHHWRRRPVDGLSNSHVLEVYRGHGAAKILSRRSRLVGPGSWASDSHQVGLVEARHWARARIMEAGTLATNNI